MIDRRNIEWLVVKTKYRVGRGQSWIAYFKDAVYVYIAILALEDLLKRFGIVDPLLIRYLLIIMVPLYFIFCYILGWFDEIKGIWKLESIYGSQNLNPYFERLNEMVKEIHATVVKMDNELMIEYKNKYEKKYEKNDGITEISDVNK
jgi:hypothetical protein